MNIKLKTGQIVEYASTRRYYKLLRNKGNNRFYCLVRLFDGAEYHEYVNFNKFYIDALNMLTILDGYERQRKIDMSILAASNVRDFFRK